MLPILRENQAVDDDAWENDEWESENEDSTIPCPCCKHSIHEESQRCPFCGSYISEEDIPPKQKPWWIIVGILAVFYVVYRWIVG